MTISKVIEIFDAETENDISVQLKKQWISELDLKIAGEINKNKEGLLVDAYTPEKDVESTLVGIEEYSEIYIVYLRMKMNYMLSEIERYNNSAALFNRLYYEMANFVSRNYNDTKKNSIKVEMNNV